MIVGSIFFIGVFARPTHAAQPWCHFRERVEAPLLKAPPGITKCVKTRPRPWASVPDVLQKRPVVFGKLHAKRRFEPDQRGFIERRSQAVLMVM